jgi:hypothetical protein
MHEAQTGWLVAAWAHGRRRPHLLQVASGRR